MPERVWRQRRVPSGCWVTVHPSDSLRRLSWPHTGASWATSVVPATVSGLVGVHGVAWSSWHTRAAIWQPGAAQVSCNARIASASHPGGSLLRRPTPTTWPVSSRIAILALSQLGGYVLRTREARMTRVETPFRDLAAPAAVPEPVPAPQ